MNRKLFTWLAVGTILLASACSSNEMLDGSYDPYVSGEEVTVSFTISAEGRESATTRAVHYPNNSENDYGSEWPQISDGSKAKKLIYAVYDKDYNLLEQYGNNYTNEDGDHYGQVIEKDITFPHTISLRLMRKQTYHIVFWAQDMDCNAYDTNDLTMVEVKYDKAKNNDELRDAFCKAETFTVSSDDKREIILTRPLAQINVGTAGYDYEWAVQNANIPNTDNNSDSATSDENDGSDSTEDEQTSDDSKGLVDESTVQTAFLYSKITISNAARFFDVLRNKVLTDEDLGKAEYNTLQENSDKMLQEVTYDWARIPAYVNYYEGKLPAKYPSMDEPKTKEKPGATSSVSEWNDYYRCFREQFLRVKLYDKTSETNEPYIPYIGKEGTSNTVNPSDKGFSPDTETFKYLSMCYVLVPDHYEETAEDGTNKDTANEDGAKNENNLSKTTLNKVTISFKHSINEETTVEEGGGEEAQKEAELTLEVLNVPVQRNWRTNIFGKNLLTLDYTPEIKIDNTFNGEYNKDGDKPWVDGENSSGYPDAGTNTDDNGEEKNNG